MIKIAITGASGRMGQALINLVSQNSSTELVGAIVRTGNTHIGTDALTFSNALIDGTLARGHCGVLFSDDADSAFAEADVVIDFCPAGATQNHLNLAIKHKTNLVIGTTGLDDAMENSIKLASRHISIVYASNFSIGVNLMFALCEKTGKALKNSGFETHIEETHHIHKIDAPSGTALGIGKSVASGRDTDFSDIYKYEQNRNSVDDITFTDIREGEVIGDHTITFKHPLETLSITHNAHERSVFASGAVMASIWLSGKAPALYSMRDVLEI